MRETELRQLLVLYSNMHWMMSTIQVVAKALKELPGMYEWGRILMCISTQSLTLIIAAAYMANLSLCQLIVRRRE